MYEVFWERMHTGDTYMLLFLSQFTDMFLPIPVGGTVYFANSKVST